MKLILMLVFSISIVTLAPAAFSESVPDWVKNTAGWWATDAISETEFVNAIEFLINDEIIISNSSKDSDKSNNNFNVLKNTLLNKAKKNLNQFSKLN